MRKSKKKKKAFRIAKAAISRISQIRTDRDLSKEINKKKKMIRNKKG